MTLQVTVFDIKEQPLAKHPVDLIENGKVISQATTDQNGVATFNTDFSNAAKLAVRSQLHQTS